MSTMRATRPRPGLLLGALLLLLVPWTDAGAAFIALTATLDGAQETPPNSSPGTGSAAFILDDVNRTLVAAASFSGLTGTTTSADIEDGSGQIVHPFPTGVAGFPTGVMQGSFTDVWTGLTPGDVAALEAGSYLIGIRTTAFPGGEIRGQIGSSAIPEPASLMLFGLGVLSVLGYAGFRRARVAA